MTQAPPDALTSLQRGLLNHIAHVVRTEGRPPSVRELAAVVGLSSPSSVKRQLDILEARGEIKRDHERRAITVFGDNDADPELAYLSETERRTIRMAILVALDTTDLAVTVVPSDRNTVATALSHVLSPVVARFIARPAPTAGGTQ